MAQPVVTRPLTVDTGVWFWASPCEIWWRKWHAYKSLSEQLGVLPSVSFFKLSRYRPEQAHGDPVG